MTRTLPGRSSPSALALGASLYVPAIHPDLGAVMRGERFPSLRSVIICTEDAIRADDVPSALLGIEAALTTLTATGPRRFVRPRTLDILGEIAGHANAHLLDGFVLPKATPATVRAALELLGPGSPWSLMPILETKDVFDPGAMREFAAMLASPAVRPGILAARIGGNDLLRCLGLRRDRARTIYESPVGLTIAQLATIFLPEGIPLTAPVFEGLVERDILRQEIRVDLAHGLTGKTAAHPDQVDVIEDQFRVRAQELEMARAVLAPESPAVFRMHGAMCETAVHAPWAELLLERASLFGVSEEEPR